MPTAPSFAGSSASSDSIDERQNELLTLLPTLFEKTGVSYQGLEFLSSGMYNTVFKFDMLDETKGVIPSVIRITRIEGEGGDENARTEACERTRNHAAILKLVQQHIKNVPKLLRVDDSTDNVLAEPYTIQTRMPGVVITRIWDELELKAKMAVTEKVADFLLAAEDISLQRSGELKSIWVDDEIQLAVQPLGEENARPFNKVEEQQTTLLDRCQTLQVQHLAEAREVKDSRANDQTKGGISKGQNAQDDQDQAVGDAEGVNEGDDDDDDADDSERKFKLLERLGTMLKEVEQVPAVGSLMTTDVNRAGLKHIDLHLGNILLDTLPSDNGTTNYNISVIDWDDAYALAPVLSRSAPIFLWTHQRSDPSAFAHWDGNVDHCPRRFRDYVDEPHGQFLKDHFDKYLISKLDAKREGAGAEWADHTYGNGIWVRRLADFCIEGFGSNPLEVGYAEELLEEWEEYQQGHSVTRDRTTTSQAKDKMDEAATLSQNQKGSKTPPAVSSNTKPDHQLDIVDQVIAAKVELPDSSVSPATVTQDETVKKPKKPASRVKGVAYRLLRFLSPWRNQ